MATTANTTYSVSGSRNGVPNTRHLNQSVSNVMIARPDSVAPVPQIELCEDGVPKAVQGNCVRSAVNVADIGASETDLTIVWLCLLMLIATLGVVQVYRPKQPPIN